MSHVAGFFDCAILADVGRENVELVRRAYEVFDTDLDGLLLMVDPSIEWVSPSDALEPGTRRGHEGVREAFAATSMAWEDPRHVATDFYAPDDDKVLVTVNFRGRGRGSGMRADQTEFHLWTLREGAVVRFEWFYRREVALRAAVLGSS
jgi:ketosteroid isomerase-like protein